MPYNKVIYKNNMLIDLTGDSVSRETLARGVTAHDKAGNPIVGEANFPITLQEKSITQNGEYTPDTGYDGFSKVSVNVADIPATLQEKTATPITSQQSITPDSGYEGLSKVTVNAIPSQYIIPTGELEITENGSYDVTEKASVSVNVESTGGGEGYQMSLSDDGTEINFVWGGAKKVTIKIGGILGAMPGSPVIHINSKEPANIDNDYEYTISHDTSLTGLEIYDKKAQIYVNEVTLNADKLWIWNRGASSGLYEINGENRTLIHEVYNTIPNPISVNNGDVITIYGYKYSSGGGSD